MNSFNKFLKKLKRVFLFAYLYILNSKKTQQIIDPSTNVIVTLTSHSDRIKRVFATIESIGLGDILPSRIILFLNLKNATDSLPLNLLRLKTRGLEIKFHEDFGPHTKYFPYLQTESNLTAPLVTADDDKLYDKDWLLKLLSAWEHDPDTVHCFRARKMKFENGVLAPYSTWPLCSETSPSLTNFATGVSGVIYPPRLQIALKSAGSAFLDCCPKADDIWLHANTIRNGFRIRQIEEKSRHFFGIPGSSRSALHLSNLAGGDNDIQILRTYSKSDLRLLQQDKSIGKNKHP